MFSYIFQKNFSIHFNYFPCNKSRALSITYYLFTKWNRFKNDSNCNLSKYIQYELTIQF